MPCTYVVHCTMSRNVDELRGDVPSPQMNRMVDVVAERGHPSQRVGAQNAVDGVHQRGADLQAGGHHREQTDRQHAQSAQLIRSRARLRTHTNSEGKRRTCEWPECTVM